jgi:hypothetical protein
LLASIDLADAKSGTLSAAGRVVEDAYWIDHDPERALDTIRISLIKLPPVQVLVQSLHAKGNVPVEGALHILMKHGLATTEDLSPLRAMLDMLNPFNILKYSRKHQSVRSAMPGYEPDASPTVRAVEPDRPYGNLRQIRGVLRECKDYVWWADPHFSKKGLEPLHDEVGGGNFTTIKILSGPSQASADAAKDFARFQTELAALGITTSWRIVADKGRTWHDRFIVTANKAWNVPPINTIYKGDYSELIRTDVRPPFEEWWKVGSDLAPSGAVVK